MLQESPMYAYIPAKDIARARQFYEQMLGFKRKQEVGGGVVYEFGKLTGCFLYPTPNAGTSKASQAFWQVDDVEREVAELRARGIEFENYDMPAQKSENGILTAGGAKASPRGVCGPPPWSRSGRRPRSAGWARPPIPAVDGSV